MLYTVFNKQRFVKILYSFSYFLNITYHLPVHNFLNCLCNSTFRYRDCIRSNDRMINEYEAVGGIVMGKKNRSTLGKFFSVPFCPPQIPYDLTCNLTRAAAVGSRRLTAWAMAQPYLSDWKHFARPPCCCFPSLDNNYLKKFRGFKNLISAS
jgi:hypothetical protein